MQPPTPGSRWSNYITGCPGTDPVDERVWLARVRAEIDARPQLAAKVAHNTFQLAHIADGAGARCLRVAETKTWPWATVLA